MEKIKNFTRVRRKKKRLPKTHRYTLFLHVKYMYKIETRKTKTKTEQNKKTSWEKTATYHRRTIFLLKRLSQQYIAAQAKD